MTSSSGSLKEFNLQFAVLGAQRGSSTFFSTLLAQFPGIDLPYLELPIFEDPFHGNVDPVELNKCFAESSIARIRGLKRPDLLGRPELAPRLAEVGIHKLIVVVRDPVDRLVSAVSWYMYAGLLAPGPIENELSKLVKLTHSGHRPTLVQRDLIRSSKYHEAISGWRSYFSEEQFMLIPDRELKDDPRRIVENSADFLGCAQDTDGRWLNLDTARRNQNYYNLTRLRFMSQRLHFSRGWNSVDEFALNRSGTRIANSLPNLAILAGFRIFDRLFLHRLESGAPQLSRDLRLSLHEIFEHDIDALRNDFPQLAQYTAGWGM